MINSEKILIIGSQGQLGRALQAQYSEAQAVDVNELDITDEAAIQNYDWSAVDIIINAAAYTNVDGAETPEGRAMADKVNARAVGYLADMASKHSLTLIHFSTDYVFDGRHSPHTEGEAFSPLSTYGKSKADGDEEVMRVPKHYLIRTSWVIGDGPNFVRTMLELGQRGTNPKVVNDQVGRLTFTSELIRAIDHLLRTEAEFGTYNVTNEGQPASWADITRAIFKTAGFNNTVTGVTTAEYYKDKPAAAKRPLQSTLDLGKIKGTGFTPHDWRDDLVEYIKKELQQ